MDVNQILSDLRRSNLMYRLCLNDKFYIVFFQGKVTIQALQIINLNF